MATTRIADVIDPEVLSDMIITKFEDNLFVLPGVVNSVDFPIPTKGTIWEIPYADTLGDLETFVPGTALTIQNMTQDVFKSVVIRKGGLYGVDKVVQLAGFRDPMEYFAEQFSDLLIKTLMETQLSVLKGGIPAGNTHTAGATISTAVIYAGKQKLGDKAGDLKYIIMNSAQYATLETAGEVIFQPINNVFPLATPTTKNQVQLDNGATVPTVAGMVIIQSDKVPALTSYMVGEGAMGLYYQQNVNFDTDRDISLKEDYISPDFDFVMPLYGVDYTSALYTTVALETAGNYTLKWDQKLVKAVKLVTI